MTAPDRPTKAPDAATGLRLGIEQERRLRMWPKARIRPKSVALGVISLLAEVDALRAESKRLTARCEQAERERDQLAVIVGVECPIGDLPLVTSLQAERDHAGGYAEQVERERDEARAALEAAERREVDLREALSDLTTVIEDARQVGEMQGEDFQMLPWSTLEAAASRYLPLLAAPGHADMEGTAT